MTDKRRKIIVFSILAIAVVWGIWNNPLSSKKEIKQVEKQPAMLGEADMPSGGDTEVMPGNTTKFNYGGWKGDPFRRKTVSRKVVRPKKEEIELKLSAISTHGKKSMAVINGKVLGNDGVIDGWAVAEIDDESVLLVKGSRNIRLSLKRR